MTQVDLTMFFPFGFILHLARAMISFNIIHTILKDKYNIWVTFFSIVGTCMVYSYISLQFVTDDKLAEQIILYVYYIIQFVVILFVTDGGIIAKILAILFSFFSNAASAVVFAVLSSIFIENAVETATTTTVDLVYEVLYSLFGYLFSFIFAIFIDIFQKKKNRIYKYKTNRGFFFLFPLTHIFCVQIVFFIERSLIDVIPYQTANRIQKLLLIFCAVCFVIDFSILFIIDHMEKIETEKEIFNEKLTKNELEYNQFLILKSEREEFRKIRHDMANILTTTKGFIEIGKPDKALEILNDTSNDLYNSAIVPISNNETLNTIYAIKSKEASENDTVLNLNVRQIDDINIYDYDLCRLLNNVIDNSINAVKNTDLDKNISISISVDENQILINSRNQFDETLKTPKKDNSLHGYGQKIIREIAKKYDGSFDIEKKNGYYITYIRLNNATPPPENLADC